MTYQDQWLNGRCVKKGVRNCSDRYNIIHSWCSKFKGSFSVLDIGANMCYFGLRLIEDFDCTVTAFEFDHFDIRKKHVEKNKTDNLMLLQRKLTIKDLSILNKYAYFDVVLALSVIHHFPGETQKWIEQLRDLGNNLFIEFALNDSKRTEIREGYSIPEDGKIIGYGDSHLKDNFKRPIVLFQN